MPCHFRAAWAVPVLLAIPHFAYAGPIEWSYRTEANYARGYGSRFLITLAPDGSATTLPGDFSSIWLFSSTGTARPEPGSFHTVYDFGIAVTITDQASGQSGTLQYSGWYSSMWMYQPEDANNPDRWRWEWEVSSFGDYWDRRDLLLGNNRYFVRAYGGDMGTSPFGEMTVEVVPSAATPEPATLALAAFGFGGIGVMRRFRRT